MSGKSLGLIETVGLAAAVEAADAALKSANVELTGCEKTNGGGLMLVTLTGEVGAVNAAVDAAVAAVRRMGKVYAFKVIARTAEGLETLLRQSSRPALQSESAKIIEAEPQPEPQNEALVQTERVKTIEAEPQPAPQSESAEAKLYPVAVKAAESGKSATEKNSAPASKPGKLKSPKTRPGKK
ncbi:BMC domain-containing protein [Kalamiella sp. sgz302252]|uniref:BMC domain-containing protein n=1 Tax=Pantoea sp. sgz302252 TaxID=3341827 RepID=UPI0036D31209